MKRYTFKVVGEIEADGPNHATEKLQSLLEDCEDVEITDLDEQSNVEEEEEEEVE